jgi:hypothetical protein
MYIKRLIETEHGAVEFSAELSGEELEVVITVGLNTLLRAGALPFLTEQRHENKAVILNSPDKKQ